MLLLKDTVLTTEISKLSLMVFHVKLHHLLEPISIVQSNQRLPFLTFLKHMLDNMVLQDSSLTRLLILIIGTLKMKKAQKC
jgi:hypothetical protein